MDVDLLLGEFFSVSIGISLFFLGFIITGLIIYPYIRKYALRLMKRNEEEYYNIFLTLEKKRKD